MRLQLSTGDEDPDDCEFVELEVVSETSSPLVDVEEDLETLTTLLAAPASVAVASDELRELAPSSSSSATVSSRPTLQEITNDTEVARGDAEDVFHGAYAPLSQQTPVTLEKSPFLPHLQSPAEEYMVLEVQMLEKEKQVEASKVELTVDVAATAIHHQSESEERKGSDPLASGAGETPDVTRTPAATNPGPTLAAAAEPRLCAGLLQDRGHIFKAGAFSGTTTSIECAQLLPRSVVAEETIAVHEEKEEGNREANQGACSSSHVLLSREEPTTARGTSQKGWQMRRFLKCMETKAHLL